MYGGYRSAACLCNIRFMLKPASPYSVRSVVGAILLGVLLLGCADFPTLLSQSEFEAARPAQPDVAEPDVAADDEPFSPKVCEPSGGQCIAVTALDFGTLALGTSKTVSLQLSNQGDVPGNLTALTIKGEPLLHAA